MAKNSSLVPVGGNSSVERAPRRDELQLSHDRSVLANIALRNPGASSTVLSDLFYNETGKRLAARTIRDDLKAIRLYWLESTIDDYEKLKAEELARLRVLEQEAWDAWRSSQSDFFRKVIEYARKPPARRPQAGTLTAQIVEKLAEKNAYLNEEVVETIVHDAIREAADEGIENDEDDDMFVAKIIETTENGVGNVQFLREIFKIQAERRKVLGLYAPERHQIDIRKAEVKTYIGWTPDEWAKKQEIIEGEIE